MTFAKPVSELIKTRRSVRTFSQEPIASHLIAKLNEFITAHAAGPFQNQIRIKLMAAQAGNADALKGLGTYGTIKHPAGFIVGAMHSAGQMNLEDVGSVMEQIILFATDIGLGTCWLGGFRQSSFARAMNLQEHETVPVVIAIGNIAEKSSLRDSFVRLMAGSKKRKSWEELFFQEKIHKPLSPTNAGNYANALEMVRLGPSASNKQPWRIIKKHEKAIFHFYLERTPGYNRSEKKFLKMTDLQRTDIGIAMCHFELSAREQGLSGSWKRSEPKISALPKLTEYVASWVDSTEA